MDLFFFKGSLTEVSTKIQCHLLLALSSLITSRKEKWIKCTLLFLNVVCFSKQHLFLNSVVCFF